MREFLICYVLASGATMWIALEAFGLDEFIRLMCEDGEMKFHEYVFALVFMPVVGVLMVAVCATFEATDYLSRKRGKA